MAATFKARRHTKTQPSMTFGSLFAGIGGFDLGLERAGMRCEWQVEIDPYAQAVLAKHWPDVRRHEDVRTFPPSEGEWGVDVICGGFPCQDISVAGKGAGLAGARSGLWYEYARIIGKLRPSYVIVENVAALLARGMGTVLSDLSALGYDAEWHVIPASAVGAPHRRDRVWIVAYSNSRRLHWLRTHARDGRSLSAKGQQRVICGGCGSKNVADAPNPDDETSKAAARRPQVQLRGSGSRDSLPNADCSRREQQRRPESVRAQQPASERCGWWSVEPDVGRVAHGVPARVDRLRGLGNAVVPQIVEVIGRAIIELDAAQCR